MRLRSLSIRRMSMASLFVVLLLQGCVTPSPLPPQPTEVSVRYEPARWTQLPGWQADQAQQAWSAFLQSCTTKRLPAALLSACAAAIPMTAPSREQARTFFESHFTPYRIVRVESPRISSDTGLITGYYEPLLH